MTFLKAAVISLTLLSPAFGQFYVITGSPTPKNPGGFESALFRVVSGKDPERVLDLVSSDSGTEWIGLAEDWRKAVLMPRDGGVLNRVVVIDFDRADVVKDCAAGPPRYFTHNEWLWDSPTNGPVLAQSYSDKDSTTEKVGGVKLDPRVPCGDSFTLLSTSDIRKFVTSGRAGVADVDRGSNMNISIDPDGRVRHPFSGGQAFFDFTVPKSLISDFRQPVGMVVAASKTLVAVDIREFSAPAVGRTLVLRRNDNTWHRIPTPTGRLVLIRNFGNYIAMIDYQAPSDAVKESSGREEWRTANSTSGPSIVERLDGDDFGYVYPGRLLLYDVASERSFVIETHQADSEILLVEQNVIYYRASDRLYSAPITGDSVGEAKLITKSDVIRDAHWAFIKH